ncbi:MAG: inorganic diphosphatase [Deltaproteobacteria bacterium]|nr:inorganic diphosphatase [Deltaproteobacteria bacterium]
MSHAWHSVTPAVEGRDLPGNFRAVIEIPKGSSNKYELDKATGMLRLDRVLSSAVYYPANYGFIPQTYAEDGDPLDVLVFSGEEIPSMCICDARAIGVMTMVDDGDMDHKIVAVLSRDPEYMEITEAADFPQHRFRMLKRFFEDYKMLEGKEVAVDEIQPAAKAHEIIETSLHRYWQARQRGALVGLRG